MNARQSTARGGQVAATWHVRDEVRPDAAPEFLRCESFSAQVSFDRAALTLAAGPDEAWVLRGSDPDLQQLVLQEQTVLQGPNMDAVAAAAAVSVGSVHVRSSRWPMLQETGVFDAAHYISLLVLPIRAAAEVAPIGTFCMARDSGLAFTDQEISQSSTFAEDLARLLLGRWRSVRDVDRFVGIIQDQHHLAAGMLASLLGMRAPQALAVMRARAFSQNRTLSDFSAEIVAALAVQPRR